MHVDLGAKQLLAAEQGTKKIAVEIKSFVSPLEMAEATYGICCFMSFKIYYKLSYIFTSKGKITVKVEPMPTSETRLISPCSNFTKRETIANPNPVLSGR